MKNLKGWGYEPSESLGEFFFLNPDVVLIFHLKTQVFEGDTDIENRLMDTGEGEGGENGESRMETYALP